MSDILYWRGNSEVRSDILAVVRGSGYAVNVATGFEAVLDRVNKKRPRAIIVDASGGENEVAARVVELSGATPLYRIPIVFLGNHVTTRAESLKREYERFLPIDIPFNLVAMLEGLRSVAPLEKPATDVIELATVASAEELGDEFQQAALPPVVPQAATALLHGGEFLRNRTQSSQFNDQELVGEHPNKAIYLRALTQLTEKNRWLGVHCRRVAGVSGALCTAINGEQADSAALRRASLMLNWGLRDQRPFFSSVDLFFPENKMFIPRILEGFRESAEFLTQIVEDDACAKMILAIVDGLRRIEDGKDNALDTQLATLLIPELIDRAVWGSGKWDQYGAHRAIRRLRQGEPVHVTPVMLDATSRLLVEATSRKHDSTASGTQDRIIPPGERTIIDEATKEAVQLFGATGHRTLQVLELRPGMILARPLLSEDGKLILRSNVELSFEILERLLQLSTIRPLCAPVVVSDKEQTANAQSAA